MLEQLSQKLVHPEQLKASFARPSGFLSDQWETPELENSRNQEQSDCLLAVSTSQAPGRPAPKADFSLVFQPLNQIL